MLTTLHHFLDYKLGENNSVGLKINPSVISHRISYPTVKNAKAAKTLNPATYQTALTKLRVWSILGFVKTLTVRSDAIKDFAQPQPLKLYETP